MERIGVVGYRKKLAPQIGLDLQPVDQQPKTKGRSVNVFNRVDRAEPATAN